MVELKSPLLVDSGNYVPVEIIQLKNNSIFSKDIIICTKNPNPLLVSFSMTKGVSTNIKTESGSLILKILLLLVCIVKIFF